MIAIGLTVISALVIGGGLALLEYQHRLATPRWLVTSLLLTAFLPQPIIALGLLAILQHLPILQLLPPLALIIIGQVLYNIPLCYLIIKTRLDTTDLRYREQFNVWQASNWQIWRWLTWPRLQSAVVTAAVIVLCYSVTSFHLPILLGGVRYQTLEIFSYYQITLWHNVTAAAWALSVQTILLMIIIIFSRHKLVGVVEQRLSQLQHTTIPLHIQLYRVAVVGMVSSPVVALVLASLQRLHHNTWQWSLANYQFVFTSHWWQAMLLTLAYSLGTTALVLIVGLLLIRYLPKKWHWLPLLPLALSPVALAVALHFFVQPNHLALLFGYVILILPITWSVLLNAQSSTPQAWFDTLQVIGATRWQALQLWLQLHQQRLRYIAVSVGAFVLSDYALVTLLKPSAAAPTMMQVAYAGLGNYRFGQAAAGFIMICVVILFYGYCVTKFTTRQKY